MDRGPGLAGGPGCAASPISPPPRRRARHWTGRASTPRRTSPCCWPWAACTSPRPMTSACRRWPDCPTPSCGSPAWAPLEAKLKAMAEGAQGRRPRAVPGLAHRPLGALPGGRRLRLPFALRAPGQCGDPGLGPRPAGGRRREPGPQGADRGRPRRRAGPGGRRGRAGGRRAPAAWPTPSSPASSPSGGSAGWPRSSPRPPWSAVEDALLGLRGRLNVRHRRPVGRERSSRPRDDRGPHPPGPGRHPRGGRGRRGRWPTRACRSSTWRAAGNRCTPPAQR